MATTVPVDPPPSSVEVGRVEGLAVRVIGEPTPGGICPGGALPCVTTDTELAEVAVDEWPFVVAVGNVVEGRLTVASAEPFTDSFLFESDSDAEPTTDEAELLAAEMTVRELLNSRDDHEDFFEVQANLDTGGVNVAVWRLDPELRAALGSAVSVPVHIWAPVEALDATLVELEDWMRTAPEPGIVLERWCGATRLGHDQIDELPVADREDALDALAAIREVFDDTGQPAVEGFDWRLVTDTATRMVLLGIPEPGGLWDQDGYGTIEVVRDSPEDRWAFDGFSAGCRPRLQAVGFDATTLALSSGSAPDPDAGTIEVLVNAVFCGEQPPDRRVEVLVVDSGVDDVALAGLVSEWVGDDCAEDDWRSVEVDLDAPLGNRSLVDAATDQPLATVER